MTRVSRWSSGVVVFAAVCASFFAVVGGCGSDSFTSAESTDGSSEASSGDASTAETGSGCLTVPQAVPAGDVAFCNAFAEVYENCGSCETCRQNDENNCAAFGGAFSDAFKAALVACKDTLDCNDLQSQSLGNSPCIAQHVQAVPPTTAQIAVETAYCGNCADAGAGVPCTDFFVLPDGGGTAGTVVLYMSDSLANDVTDKCTARADCNELVFGVCELNQLCNGAHAAPKTQCTTGLCK